jgi:hypothetical protein
MNPRGLVLPSDNRKPIRVSDGTGLPRQRRVQLVTYPRFLLP